MARTDLRARSVVATRVGRRSAAVSIDGPLARVTGLLCARAGTADIVDASAEVIAAARARGSSVALVTSDPGDLGHLLQTLGAAVRLITV